MIDGILFKARRHYGNEWMESHSILQGKEETYLRNETDSRETWVHVNSETVLRWNGKIDTEGNKVFI